METTHSSPLSSPARRDLHDRLQEAYRPPRIRVEPQGAYQTDGDKACELCAHYWFTPDEWQRQLLRCWLSRDENGNLLVISAGLSCPRQNGKNGAVECLEFYLLITQPGIKILHTAHSTKTAQKAWDRMCRVFGEKGGIPGKKREGRTIRKLVDPKQGGAIRKTNGEWAIFLSNGSSIEYSTRTNAGGRGFDGINYLIYDEAQELTDEHVEALGPVTDAAVGDSVIFYLGTPPNETAAGEVFFRHRKAALTNPGPRECWHEWSIETLPDEHSTFEDLIPLIEATNPSYELDRPGHLTEDRTRRNFADLSFEGFCRERLGYWSEAEVIDPALDFKAWQKLENKHPRSVKGCKRTIGIKFSPDGSHVAVVNAWKYGCGKPHVELSEYANIEGKGLAPLADALYRLRNKVALILIDGANAQALADLLGEKKYPKGGYAVATTRDAIAAASGLKSAISGAEFTHYGQEALDESAKTSTKRKIGNAWGFGGACPEPIDATGLALRAMRTTKRNPAKKTVVYY